MKYDCVMVFRKMTDLMPFYKAKEEELIGPIYRDDPAYDAKKKFIIARYSEPRIVRLILLVRYDGRHTFCKVKCPVNPLPVKGEFEAPSLNALVNFLKRDGWTETESIAGIMLD